MLAALNHNNSDNNMHYYLSTLLYLSFLSPIYFFLKKPSCIQLLLLPRKQDAASGGNYSVIDSCPVPTEVKRIISVFLLQGVSLRTGCQKKQVNCILKESNLCTLQRETCTCSNLCSKYVLYILVIGVYHTVLESFGSFAGGFDAFTYKTD